MYLPYTDFRYLYPPRTEMRIPPGPGPVRKMWEAFPDAIAQFKENGTRNMFYIFPDQHAECWNRGADGTPTQQKQYSLTKKMTEQLGNLKLPAGKFHVLDGELLHSKTTDIKDVSYMFDILVYNGEYLLGATYGERYALLRRLMGDRFFPEDLNPKIGEMYLAQSFPVSQWGAMWEKALAVKHCEGLVLKRTGPISRLVPGTRIINNDGFMLRVRKPHKNYEY